MKFKIPFWLAPTLISVLIAYIFYRITNDFNQFLTVTALFSMSFLALTLMPGNIGKITTKFPSDNFFKKLIIQLVIRRKDFGIAFGLTILVHAIFAELQYYNFHLEKLLQPDLIPGVIAILLIIFMLVTSIEFIQRKLRSWKMLHSVIWFCVPIILVHGIFSSIIFKGDLGIVNVISVVLFIFAFAKFFIGGPNSQKLRDIILILLGIFIGVILTFINLSSLAALYAPLPVVSKTVSMAIISNVSTSL